MTIKILIIAATLVIVWFVSVELPMPIDLVICGAIGAAAGWLLAGTQ